MSKTHKAKSKWQVPFWLLLLLTIVGCAGLIAYIGNRIYEDPRSNLTGSGTFGDSFGFVNAFAALMGATLLIWTLRLQAREFALMVQEYKESKIALKQSADAQEALHIATLQGQCLEAARIVNADAKKALAETEEGLALQSNKHSLKQQELQSSMGARLEEHEKRRQEAVIEEIAGRVLRLQKKKDEELERIAESEATMADMLSSATIAIQSYKQRKLDEQNLPESQ